MTYFIFFNSLEKAVKWLMGKSLPWYHLDCSTFIVTCELTEEEISNSKLKIKVKDEDLITAGKPL